MWASSKILLPRLTRSVSSIASVSPPLLNRARAIAADHAALCKQNAESYDTPRAKKIGELSAVTTALADWDNAQNSIIELNSLLADPVSDGELRSLAADDLTTTRASLPDLTYALKRSLIPSHPFALLPCFLEIHPGAGGSEASLFAATLLQMYRTYCSNNSWPCTLVTHEIDTTTPSAAGITSAILEVSQPRSYDTLKTEAGVHRVQRVPATEKKGRTHTSAVSVLVLPSFPTTNNPDADPEDPNSDSYISPADVRVESMRARGAGGQHVNKTDSAVRLTHIPTGTVVAMQDSRHQAKNRIEAWKVLRGKIAARRREEREAEMVGLRRKIMGGTSVSGREDKIRTYNYAQNRVTDHRCGSESADLSGVLDAREPLDKIMVDVREWMLERDVLDAAALEEEKAGKEG